MEKKHAYVGDVPISVDSKEDSIEITTAMLLANNLETLEHIDVRVWINHLRCRNVIVELVSPNGIRSVLTDIHAEDNAKTGYPGWRFMTIKHWYISYNLVVPTSSKLDFV